MLLRRRREELASKARCKESLSQVLRHMSRLQRVVCTCALRRKRPPATLARIKTARATATGRTGRGRQLAAGGGGCYLWFFVAFRNGGKHVHVLVGVEMTRPTVLSRPAGHESALNRR